MLGVVHKLCDVWPLCVLHSLTHSLSLCVCVCSYLFRLHVYVSKSEEAFGNIAMDFGLHLGQRQQHRGCIARLDGEKMKMVSKQIEARESARMSIEQ